jgi:hypothetical protein
MQKSLAVLALLALIQTACGRNVRDECFIDGQTISCPKRGTSVTIPTAINGQDGAQGVQGEQGPAGVDAEPCTVTDTEKGAIIECPDGSSVEVFDGADGKIIICHRKKHGHRTCRG